MAFGYGLKRDNLAALARKVQVRELSPQQLMFSVSPLCEGTSQNVRQANTSADNTLELLAPTFDLQLASRLCQRRIRHKLFGIIFSQFLDVVSGSLELIDDQGKVEEIIEGGSDIARNPVAANINLQYLESFIHAE